MEILRDTIFSVKTAFSSSGQKEALKDESRHCGHSGHDHSEHSGHSHGLSGESFRSEKNLKIAFFLTIIILVIEFAGAVVSGSMALYSDSGHILVDASSLLLAWFAQAQVRKLPNEKNTYGFHRMGIIAALLNSSVLFMLSLALLYESYSRLIHPHRVKPEIMIFLPIISLAVNSIIGLKIHKDIHNNLNLKSSFFHILGDSVISVAIIIAGIIIYFTGFYEIDPIMGMVVAPVIAAGAFSVINETLGILLERVPREIDFSSVKNEILAVPGVKSLHDLHIWSMSKSFRLLSAHIVIDDKITTSSETCCIINDIQSMLENRFNISHAVIQPELTSCDAREGFCIHRNI